ncbi:MAG: serine hydrolase domain-containing protein [Pyrinomonadaceae bacterium]
MRLSSARFVSTFIILILVGAVLGQQSPDAQLGATDAGKRIVQYFQAFNEPDEQKLRSFFENNIAAASLAERPVEPRLAFHKQVKSDFGKIVVDSVVAVTPDEIKVVGRSANGSMISYSFQISPTDGKIVGLTIEPDGPRNAPPPPPPLSAPKTVAELPAAIRDLFDSAARDGRFSGVVLVAKDGVPNFNKAWGMAAVDKSLPNRLDTKFNLGSINKLFTRIAIGQLVKAGKLSFSSKLIDVLPDYPNKTIAAKITIGQMITMTSGLGDFFNDDFVSSDHSKIRSLRDYLPLFANIPLEFEPGTKSRYSNAGYLVLGLVIEKLSGGSYYDYVRKNVFELAGMSDTDSYEIDKLPANTAIGYMKKGSASPLTPNVGALPGRGSSAGGGYSTAPDLLRLAKALKEGKLVVPKDDGTFPTTFESTGIAGGSEGVNALFLTNAASGCTVIVLSNLDPPSATQPGTQVRDWIKQLTPQ